MRVVIVCSGITVLICKLWLHLGFNAEPFMVPRFVIPASGLSSQQFIPDQRLNHRSSVDLEA